MSSNPDPKAHDENECDNESPESRNNSDSGRGGTGDQPQDLLRMGEPGSFESSQNSLGSTGRTTGEEFNPYVEELENKVKNLSQQVLMLEQEREIRDILQGELRHAFDELDTPSGVQKKVLDLDPKKTRDAKKRKSADKIESFCQEQKLPKKKISWLYWPWSAAFLSMERRQSIKLFLLI